MRCWIRGKTVQLPNGHRYIAEPYIVFTNEAEAHAAADMVAKVSGERPGKAEGSFYNNTTVPA